MDDFADWEVLHDNSKNPSVGSNSSSSDSASVKELGDLADELLDAAAAASHGVIQADYFSIDFQSKPSSLPRGDSPSQGGSSVASDNPSWIDPASPGTLHLLDNSGDLWSDSGTVSPNSRELSDGGGSDKGETRGLAEHRDFVENLSETRKPLDLVYNTSEEGFTATPQVGDDDAAIDFIENGTAAKVEIWTDSAVLDDKRQLIEVSKAAKVEDADADDASSLELGAAVGDGGNNSGKGVDSGEEVRRGRIVWWKVPLELLKYCVFKVRPVWTVSMAAAILGIVMLGRRLYRMKRKTQGLQLKVILDDKKVSQFMSKAARLNEAFSVVRRVPVVRPSLPATAPGMVVPWPVMSMR